jgi:Uma2 family endonuclease
MATATPTPTETPTPSGLGVVFRDVTWADYEAQLRIVGDRPIRVIYDRGTMEVIRPSFAHEDDAYRLGRIVDTLTEELGIAVKAGRTTTHKRQDLDRGAEPDQCYWFGENARRMVGKRRLDLGVDPRPDLAIEVDITQSSLDRLPIFAPLGIPEAWRLADGSIEFLHLEPDGTYQARGRSLAFPALAPADVARFLEQGRAGEDTAWVRTFRAFVREALAPPPADPQ